MYGFYKSHNGHAIRISISFAEEKGVNIWRKKYVSWDDLPEHAVERAVFIRYAISAKRPQATFSTAEKCLA